MDSGLYFHIPFCLSKCPYCDFYSTHYTEEAARRFTGRLIQEFEQYSGVFDTVYFGGGTPSLLPAAEIGRILAAARTQFTIKENSEITIECNPSKDLAQDFLQYAACGVNRISIGMQSAVDKERFALGRRAGAVQVKKMIADAKKAGIQNISLDIMLGTPKQTLASLEETFAWIADAGVTHISAYMLKLEPGTKFFDLQDRLALPDEDTVCKMYLKTVDALESLGFHQYEISNFARPGFESRHNLKYWQLAPYLGIGPTAHSYWNGNRFFYNEKFEIVPDGSGGSAEERIMLGLRLRRGVLKTWIHKPYQDFIKMGFMEENGDYIAFTPRGMLLSNTLIAELTD